MGTSIITWEELHLSRNPLTSLNGLAGLAHLEVLHVSEANLREVASHHIKGLSKLDELQLNGNKLVDLSMLVTSGPDGATRPNLPALTMLDISDNKLTVEALGKLPTMTQLAELNLAGNELSTLPSTLPQRLNTLEILD
eukprot:189353-Amphidinium_carterae.1